MDEIGAFEAKNKLAELLDRAERGEEITITRRGKPVAKLVPFHEPFDPAEALAAAERIRQRARSKKREPFDWEEWKKYRDEGRP
jgi:prevent-host-death family protein